MGLITFFCFLFLGAQAVISHRSALQRTCPGATHQYNVRSYGALGDGVTCDRAAIQAAIDHASAHKGCVIIPAGIYLTGGLVLKKYVTLYIDVTATLRASTNGSDWVAQFDHLHDVGAGESNVAGSLIAAVYAHGSAVLGEGTLDGQCPQYITGSGHPDGPSGHPDWNSPWKDQLTFTTLAVPGYGSIRPSVMAIAHSVNITISGVTLTDSHGWTSKFLNCTNVMLSDLNVYGDFRMPNNDGIDPCSSTNVTLDRVNVNVGDDAVSAKTNVQDAQGNYLPLHGLRIINSRLRSRSFAIKFGTETHANMSDILVDNVQIYDSHQGVGIDWRGAGNISKAQFSNINIVRANWDGSGSYMKPHWMGNAQPIFVSNDVWSHMLGSGEGTVSDLKFVNITSVSENGVFISGRHGGVRNIDLINVRVVIQQSPKNNATDGPHPAHNYHPTDGTDVPEPDAPVDGFFVEYASDVRFLGCSAAFSGFAKDGNRFGHCVRLGNGTDQINTSHHVACKPPARPVSRIPDVFV